MKNFKLLSIALTVIISSLVFSCAEKELDPFILELQAKGIDAKTVNVPDVTETPLFELTEIMSIGGEMEDTPLLFQPGQVIVNDSGEMIFTDEQKLKIFDADGNFMKIFADKGQGPGEVEWPWIKQIINDELIVGSHITMGSGKYEVFNPRGGFIKRIKNPSIKDKLFDTKRSHIQDYLGNDKFLFESYTDETEENGKQFRSLKYGIADIEGNLIKELDIDLEPIFTWIRVENGGISVAMTNSSISAVVNDNLYALTPDGKDVYKYDLNGTLLSVFRIDLPRVDVSNEERQKTLERYENRTQFIDAVKKYGIPADKPPVFNIMLDDKNYIWLQRSDTFGPFGMKYSKFNYVVLNSDGEYLGEQSFPIKVDQIKNNKAYGFLTDENGLRIFKVYGLQ